MATSASHYLLDESVEALNQIDGISEEVYAKAIEKFENEDKMSLNVARFNKDNLLDDSDDEFGEILLYFACEEYNQLYLSKQPCRNSSLSGHEYVMEVLHGHWSRCYDLFRMNKDVFKLFCDVLKEKKIIEELMISHSISTTSHYFRKVLKAICRLSKELITPSSFDVTPPQIRFDPRYYSFFKFTYVVLGWEGLANDARILLECATNPDYGFPMPPQGKYYLVDSGYTNMPGLLSPYRGERYHLGQYTDLNPIGKKELFNYRHSSLRNIIERCFGVLKARFPILKQMPSYDLRIRKYIVIACCGIHNFIRINAEADVYFDGGEGNSEVQATTLQSTDGTLTDSVEFSISRTHIREMTHVRDEIADHIWRASRR
ncbi:uncharacterized protein LOC133785388 [Humulus lupulus]|uniref:uncharacterized protein LOC133785388 n=1 Tax=Humulus lupulus TaxID=3486 RepID=UPI002B414710|nr:uncharacterized protein LOC133785388 [Humulus lupulus]